MILRVQTFPASLFASVRNVFLDRDGVINRKAPEGHYVARWDQFHLLPGVADAIATLNAAGLLVFLVTNQRGVALGLYTEEDVQHLHLQLSDLLAQHQARIDGYYYCPHDKGCCTCRKPLTGLFEQAFDAFPGAQNFDSVVIGDSLSDIEAGHSLGMRTIFIEGDVEHRKPGAEKAALLADAVSASLAEAVSRFLPV
jgi:D-glycero-D-manno-heptose 1,7-bisphosphate phosphatase